MLTGLAVGLWYTWIFLLMGAIVWVWWEAEEKFEKEANDWSEEKLHAYAGVATHSDRRKKFCYELAKKKRWERAK